MAVYDEVRTALRASPKTWLVTGVAGFIGSNLLEALLRLGQQVVGLDSFATGSRNNLSEVQARLDAAQWGRFRLLAGDIADLSICRESCRGVDLVLHHAALGSVPGSMADPAGAHRSNVTGFINVLLAAREAKVKRLVYASSSAVYGDDPQLPKVEDKIGNPLSPYAATKLMNEIYADVFARAYAFDSVGLRYFNVFGPRQDPNGPYAAVIPQWTASMLKTEPVFINGDGETTRDFCFIENVVQANLLAATTQHPEALNKVYNVALGESTTLNELFDLLQSALVKFSPKVLPQQPKYRDFRPGDVRHSRANTERAERLLGYKPSHRIRQGLDLTMEWYCAAANSAAGKT